MLYHMSECQNSIASVMGFFFKSLNNMDSVLLMYLLVTEQYSEATINLIIRNLVSLSEQNPEGLVPHMVPSGHTVARTAVSEAPLGALCSF